MQLYISTIAFIHNLYIARETKYIMTRFARKGGVVEKREDKRKKEDATEWSEMLRSNEEGGDQGEDVEERKSHHKADLDKKIELDNSNQLPSGFIKRKLLPFEKPVRHYLRFIDPDVLDQLNELKKNHKITMNEYYQQVKAKARSNQRRLDRKQERESNRCCFKCRQLGHSINDCPEMSKDMEQGTGVCYKCGSTEHHVTACKVKVEPGHYPFAKCFICNEVGHLTKQCPDNPKGLYPNGGCCKSCGSVEHFYRDCPEVQKQSKKPIRSFGAYFIFESDLDLLAEAKTIKKFKPTQNLDDLSDDEKNKKPVEEVVVSSVKKKRVVKF